MPRRPKGKRPPSVQTNSWAGLAVASLIALALAGFGWTVVVITVRHVLVYGLFEGFGGRFGEDQPLGTILLSGVIAGVGTYWFVFGIREMWRKALLVPPGRPKPRARQLRD